MNESVRKKVFSLSLYVASFLLSLLLSLSLCFASFAYASSVHLALFCVDAFVHVCVFCQSLLVFCRNADPPTPHETQVSRVLGMLRNRKIAVAFHTFLEAAEASIAEKEHKRLAMLKWLYPGLQVCACARARVRVCTHSRNTHGCARTQSRFKGMRCSLPLSHNVSVVPLIFALHCPASPFSSRVLGLSNTMCIYIHAGCV